jgi:hypothetical protein
VKHSALEEATGLGNLREAVSTIPFISR